MRIIVGGLAQENNSFSSAISGRERFDIFHGDEILSVCCEGNSSLGGIVAAVREAGGTVVPAVKYSAQSGGPMDRRVVEEFLQELLSVMDADPGADGVFLDMHGATEAVGGLDVCGYVFETIRKHAGDRFVIASSTDLHGNISRRMIENANIIAGWQTYPHVDQYTTGHRAASQGIMLLQGKPLCQACVRIPMIVPAESYNTNEGPFADLIRSAHELVDSGKIIDFTIYQMQPWLDLPDSASTVLVSAEDKETAGFYARKLAHELFDIRKQMDIHLYPVEEVVQAARDNTTDAPVILVDSADSPNAGSSADSSYVLSYLLEHGRDIRACLSVSDAPAAAHAFEVGVGQVGTFTLGGTREPDFQKSITVEAYVKSLHDGRYMISAQGIEDTGKSAVLQVGNVDIVVYTQMKSSSNPQNYRGFGIEPSLYRLVVVKSATQYKELYSAFSTLFYPTDTPGSSTANLRQLPFKRLPRPFYPLDEMESFDDAVSFSRAF